MIYGGKRATSAPHRRHRRIRALLASLLLATATTTTTTGCTLVADDEQKRAVRENLKALPSDVDRALRPGKVRLHFHGEVGTDVSADRQVTLAVGAVPPTTTGRWTVGCRAAVAALASTSGRLYGQLPDGRQRYEATDDLCRRGLGHPLGSTDRPQLWIGLPQPDGRVLDTAVNLDAAALTIETYGSNWRDRGTVIEVTPAVPAELDRAVVPTALPWRYRPEPRPAGSGWLRLPFVVPSGTQLLVTADCGEPDPRRHVELDARSDGNYLTFAGGAPSDFPQQQDRMRACGQRLALPLRPQASYDLAGGQPVDRYQLMVSPARRTDDSRPAHEVRVTVIP